jgi:hypothetical protein
LKNNVVDKSSKSYNDDASDEIDARSASVDVYLTLCCTEVSTICHLILHRIALTLHTYQSTTKHNITKKVLGMQHRRVATSLLWLQWAALLIDFVALCWTRHWLAHALALLLHVQTLYLCRSYTKRTNADIDLLNNEVV